MRLLLKHKNKNCHYGFWDWKNNLVKVLFLIGLVTLLGLPTSQVYAEITSASPPNPNLGETVHVSGSGFGDYTAGSSTITLTNTTTGENFTLEPAYPASSNWTDTKVVFQIPADIPFGEFSFSVNGQSAPLTLDIVEHYTPPNLNGTPYYTEDYIISNTQAVNVSEAVRSVAQSFLLPIKESIIEVGTYTEGALTFKLTLGGEEATADGGSGTIIEDLWMFTRGLANSLFLVLMVMAGFMIIFRFDRHQYQYSIRAVIPRFIAAVSLVNMSYLISRMLIDFTLVFTYSILDSLDMPSSASLATQLLGDLNLNLFVLFMVGLYLFILTLYSFVLIFLILRVVAIWLMTIFSPLIFMLVIFPQGDQLVRNWFKKMSQLLLVGPIAAFLLFVGYNISQTASEFENTELMRAFIGSSTLVTMLVIPFILSSMTSFFQQQISPNAASNVANAPGRQSTNTPASATNPSGSAASNNTDAAKGSGQYKKVDLHEVDKDKLKTMSIPLSDQMQDKFKQILQGRQSREESLANSIFKSHVGSGAVTGQATNASSEQKKATAIRQILQKQTQKGASAVGMDSAISPSDQSLSQFNDASPQLIISWLEDESGNKHIVQAGISNAQGNIDPQKAAAIFSGQSGRGLLSQMIETGNTQEQDASANLIGNVLQTDPQSMNLVSQDIQNGSAEVKSAAGNVIRAGIQRLGERLQEDPNNQQLKNAAEHLILQAPDLLASALKETNQSGADFIQKGVQESANTIGQEFSQASQNQPLGTALKQEGSGGDELRKLSSAAGHALLSPQVDISKLAQDKNGQMFITGALLCETPDPVMVRERFAQSIEKTPDNPVFNQISKDVYNNTDTQEIRNLPTSISSSVAKYMQTEEFLQQPDPALLGKYLQGNSSQSLIAAGPLSTEVLAKVDAKELVKNLPADQQASALQALPAQMVLAGSIPEIQEKSPALLEQVQTNLPKLVQTNNDLAGATALKLLADSQDQSTLAASTLDLARQALANPQIESIVPAKTLDQVGKALLANSSPEQLKELSQNNVASQNMLNHGLPALAADQETAARVLPHLIDNEALLSQISSQTTRDTLAQISPDQIEKLISNPIAQAFLGKKSVTDLNETQVMDGQAAVNTMLMSAEADVKDMPWNVIKACMKEMVKMDRENPMYLKLNDKIEQTSPEARTQAQESLQLEQGSSNSSSSSQTTINSQNTQAAIKAEAIANSEASASSQAQSVASSEANAASSAALNQAIEKLAQTPTDQVAQLDPTTLEYAFQQLTQQIAQGQSVSPELSVKSLASVSVDQAMQADDSMKWQAHDHLSQKSSPTPQDCQTMSKIVVTIPTEDLSKLSEQALNMAKSTLKTAPSNASREGIQSALKGELGIMQASSDPSSGGPAREKVKF